jgi:hypothetical protein
VIAGSVAGAGILLCCLFIVGAFLLLRSRKNSRRKEVELEDSKSFPQIPPKSPNFFLVLPPKPESVHLYLQNIEIEGPLGSGSFGLVYKGIWLVKFQRKFHIKFWMSCTCNSTDRKYILKFFLKFLMIF